MVFNKNSISNLGNLSYLTLTGGFEMIIYFSGTGNSKYTAEMIKSVIGGEIVCLNTVIKSGKKQTFNSPSPFVVVCPTYAWRIPRVVENVIKESDFTGSKEIYFVLTCGAGAGNAISHAKSISEEKGLIFKGLKSVVMPENYIAMFNAPQKDKADKIIKNAEPKITKIAETIKSRGLLEESSGIIGKFLSGPVNPMFYSIFVKAKGFYATDKCISCGLCANLCPLNNISLKEGKPVWQDRCTHCMACICRCPEEAIEYKNKTKGKPRYHI